MRRSCGAGPSSRPARRSGRGSPPPSPISSRRWSPSRPTRRPRPMPPAAGTRPGCVTRRRPGRWPPAAATSPSGRPGSRSGPRWSPTAWPTSSAGWVRASVRRPTRLTGSSAPSARRSPSSASTRWSPRHRAVIDVRLAELQDERRRQSDEARRCVTGTSTRLRRDRAEAERQLDEIARAAAPRRDRRGRGPHAARGRRRDVRRDLDTEPDTAVAAPAPPLPEGVDPGGAGPGARTRAASAGPDQPARPRGVHRAAGAPPFLEEQLEDVRSDAARAAAGHPRRRRRDPVSVFAAAYADVSENFTALFATLFPGGTGRLVLTDARRPADTGIEVEAKPSGKNVKKLSLLSGGERSLTALAFLFAVFRSRPSPFYVMDEVEAALDDVNLHRFLGPASPSSGPRRSSSSSATRSGRWRRATACSASRCSRAARPRSSPSG